MSGDEEAEETSFFSIKWLIVNDEVVDKTTTKSINAAELRYIGKHLYKTRYINGKIKLIRHKSEQGRKKYISSYKNKAGE
jgi:hypothetical protein